MGLIEKQNKDDYVILTMQRPKVNALNHELVQEIRNSFQEIENNESERGVILTGMPGVFSAGLDLIELFDYDEQEIRDFFIAFGSMYIELAKFKKPFVCAVSGHSPAGGTVIAVTADYRIMVGGEKFGIGLNEVSVNVQITNNLIEAYSFWLGRQRAYKNVLAGALLNPTEALEGGLVDEVVTQDELLPKSEARMRHYLNANNEILINTKAKLRKDWLEKLNENAEEDLETSLRIWWSPEVRMKMQMFKEMLKAKKAAS